MSTAEELYSLVSRYFLIIPAILSPSFFFFNAPFGRFRPSKASCLLVDGIKSWIIMEIVSPLCFLAGFFSSPLTRSTFLLKRRPFSPPPMITKMSFATFSIPVPNAPALLALLFLGHYLNRALLSPLRSPTRSKSHILVPLSGICFNIVNGSLMGACIAAIATPKTPSGIELDWYHRSTVSANWAFWAGITMWLVGFASNIWHDEVLFNLRRKQPAVVSHNPNEKHYAIPHGGLYALISYPNYFSEWFEWLGYAIATSALTSQLPNTHVVFPVAAGRLPLGTLSSLPYISQLTPPWIFLLAEVLFMFPRAWNGHKWYHKTLPEYPRERTAVVPFLL